MILESVRLRAACSASIHVDSDCQHGLLVLAIYLLLPLMSLKVHACCCWACSICPLGEEKPPCGGQGYKKGGTKRGLASVLNNIVTVVRSGVEEHELVLPRRGMLKDDAEMEALAEAVIERELPTKPGMEECYKCCDVCRDKAKARLRNKEHLLGVLNLVLAVSTNRATKLT